MAQRETRTADRHDGDFQRLHQTDQPRLVHAVGNLPAGGRQQHKRRDEDRRNQECRRRRVRIAEQRSVVGDQRGKRHLENVVVHRAQELGPEERCKATLLQQRKLARLAHRQAVLGSTKNPLAMAGGFQECGREVAQHGLGHVVEGNHAHQRAAVEHWQIAHMVLQHDAAHFVDFGFGRAGDGMIVHHLADGRAIAHGTVVFGDHLDDFPEGQHADQFASVLPFTWRMSLTFILRLPEFGVPVCRGSDRARVVVMVVLRS
ncbi:Protein ITSN-1, isoform a [Corchorus olitorius]|uniref:Protein ITSN-1, isoform a n=1 Tax=Corchorus olitorius TaxID=93759 RepID=A0A1R3L0Z1_9ROSI|nr:Protein ITSN-1, isoform a [Corchorus olitorius]